MFRRVLMILLIGGWLCRVDLCLASPLEESDVNYAKDSERRAEDGLIADRRTEFLEHLKNARHINLPQESSAFAWKIDWKRQKQFCEKVVEGLFHDKKKLTFPAPIFSSVTGTREQLLDAFDRELAPNTCPNIIDESLAPTTAKVSTHRPMGKIFGPWGSEGYSLRLYSSQQEKKIFFVAEFLKPKADYSVDDVNGLWGAIPNSPIMAQGFYLATGDSVKPSNGALTSCMPRGSIEAAGYPSSRSDRQKLVIGEIGGRLMTFEFGTYSEKRFPGYERMDVLQSSRSGALWGRIGQQYVLVKDIEMSFVGSWALSRPGDNFAGANQVMDAHTKDDAYSYACVINFDKSNR